MVRSGSVQSSRANYSTLEPRVHYVTKGAIKKRWKKLTPGAYTGVQELLSASKHQGRSSKSARNASSSTEADCIDIVTEKLIERLPRMPFPSSTTDESFDFESTLHRINNLEEQLTSIIHSMNILRAQIKNEERILEDDQREVEQLDNNLKTSDFLRVQQARNLHHITKDMSHALCNGDHDNSIVNERGDILNRTVDLTKLSQDADLLPLLTQLRSHMDSLQKNTAGMHSILQVMSDTGQALRRVSSAERDASRT